jgi:hypothetical protein
MKALPIRFSWFALFLIVLGLSLMLHRLQLVDVPWYSMLWILVTILAAIRLFNGFVLKKRGNVFWGFFWMAIGCGATLYAYNLFDPGGGMMVAAATIVVGVAFLLMFVTVPRDWYVLVPAAFFLLLGGTILCVELGYFDSWDVAPLISSYWPVALILFGGAILLNKRSSS